MRKIFKNNKGMTLIEILIAMGLAVVTIGIVSSLFLFSHRSFSREEEYYDIQNDVRIATDYIVRTVRSATSMEMISVSASGFEISGGELYNYIYIDEDGSVHSYLTDGAGGYEHKILGQNINSISSYFYNYDSDTISIHIEATKEAQQYYSDVNVNLINFELFDTPPEITLDDTDYKAIKFVLP